MSLEVFLQGGFNGANLEIGSQLKKLKMLQKKYSGSRKYLKGHRRCKIEFWTTFVFYTMLIFPLLLEFQKIFGQKYFAYYLKAFQLKNEWKNQHSIENKSCPAFDFISSKVLQIFSGHTHKLSIHKISCPYSL